MQSFYVPRSNQDGYGVMPHCIDDGPVQETVIEYFDGKNWENCIKEKPEIKERSKKTWLQHQLLLPNIKNIHGNTVTMFV